jgi:hypothetical protein
VTAPDYRQDIGARSVPAGDPLTWIITINGPTGTGIDLTVYGTAWGAKARTSYLMEPPVVFTVDYSAAATGVLKLSLTGTQTAGMTTDSNDSTNWQFDLQATGGTVTPQTPFKGRLTVQRVNTHG